MGGEPEFELRKLSNEGAKLVGFPNRQERAGLVIALPAETFERGVGLRREKRDDEAEDIDGQGVGNEVEPLHDEDPDDVGGGDGAEGHPPQENVRRGLVQVVLVPAADTPDPASD